MPVRSLVTSLVKKGIITKSYQMVVGPVLTYSNEDFFLGLLMVRDEVKLSDKHFFFRSLVKNTLGLHFLPVVGWLVR